jgi:synaptobrevin homolog YKT6
MTIISLAIGIKKDCLKNTIIHSISYNLDDYYFFQRNSVTEMCNFVSRTLMYKNKPGTLQKINHDKYIVYSVAKFNGLSAVAILDSEYPQGAIFRLLNKIIFDFTTEYGHILNGFSMDYKLQLSTLNKLIIEYQNPKKDKFHKINSDLDDTKIIMHKSIEKILDRGEKIENLVQRSKDLSKSSKKFFKTSRKFNSCCVIF